MANRLSTETSPYLLQHAHNPVDWYPWGQDALQKAALENKLLLVSIGYSACHWCHVMERECFEDKSVAEIMNQHFVCIKIDREERPDVDQVYMLAVQLMTGRGGWPLNCICLPDQRPIYGGTYFRKDDWKNILLAIADFWQTKPKEAEEYAERLTRGIDETEKLDLSNREIEFNEQSLKDIFEPWKQYFDHIEGGMGQATKFPMPNNWQFLMRYAHHFKDQTAFSITKLTLQKMAYGGIYDHLGGGFARYSVDPHWHVPHFEKMLYDNAQLLSLYAEAWQFFKSPLFKEVVYETVGWLQHDMLSPEGGFYSALDADSEGVEGKFYTFTRKEIDAVLGEDSKLFCEYFNITSKGNWEEEATNVLRRSEDDEVLAERAGMEPGALKQKVAACKQKLFVYREQRIKPGLDNKILASWNGLSIKGLCDAYKAFNEPQILSMALRNGEFILNNLKGRNGALVRLYNPHAGKVFQPAFLDDYAFVAEGFINLYEVTFDERWLLEARNLCNYALQNFYDPGTGMLYYTSQNDTSLIARKHEILDNVIPASNSAMAHNLFKLGHLFNDEIYLDQARQMLRNVSEFIKTYGSGYSNWAMLLLNEVARFYEIAITGPEASSLRKGICQYFIPNKVLLGGNKGTLPLLEGKFGPESRIFVCYNKSCQLPVNNVEDALAQIGATINADR